MATIVLLVILSQCFSLSLQTGIQNKVLNGSRTSVIFNETLTTVSTTWKTQNVVGLNHNQFSPEQNSNLTDDVYLRNSETNTSGTNETKQYQNFSNIVKKSIFKGDLKLQPGATEDNTTYRNDLNTDNYRLGENIFELPKKWVEFCYLSGEIEYSSEFTPPVNLTTVKCDVTPEVSGVWKITDLRRHLSLYNASDLKYGIDITCHSWSNVSISWPMKVHNLFTLSVKNCQITDFLTEFKEEFIQTTPDSLRVLDLSDNRVLIATDTYIDITKNVRNILPEFDCGHDRTLERMSVRNVQYKFIDSLEQVYTRLTELGEQFMLDSRRLTHRCDFQHLTYLDEGQSESMSIYHMELKDTIFYELRVYNLSNNYLKVLKDKQLQWSITFPKLEMLDLSHNHISQLYRFEIPIHTRMDRLTTINLQYNNISTITVGDLERFQEMPMMFVDLRNNPIHCNCTAKTKNLLQYIKEKRYLKISNLTDYSYIKDMRCFSPERLKGKTLESLTDLDILCEVEKEYFLVPILVLSGAIVVLSVVLFILLRFRQELMVILFTRFNIIVPCQHRQFDDSTKKYDAFVSYSSHDEDWVESLFGELENHSTNTGQQFKFCLHHRDFILGKTIFDNVIRSVESSRHTIVLLSNYFLKSEYCLYEFQEAFRQSIMEQKRHLVIVMMEDIAAHKMPRDLRRCIKTFTYIKKDDYLFRERLIYALSVKQKSQVVEKKSKTGMNTTDINIPQDKNTPPNKNTPRDNNTSPNKNTSQEIEIPSGTCTLPSGSNSPLGLVKSSDKTPFTDKNTLTDKIALSGTDQTAGIETSSVTIPSSDIRSAAGTKSVINMSPAKGSTNNVDVALCNGTLKGQSIYPTDIEVNVCVKKSENDDICECEARSDYKCQCCNVLLEKAELSKRYGSTSTLHDKGLMLSLENDNTDHLMEMKCTKDVCRNGILYKDDRLDKIVTLRDIDARTTDYDRSISTISQDTGYFSDKGSPDICPHALTGSERNMFSIRNEMNSAISIV